MGLSFGGRERSAPIRYAFTCVFPLPPCPLGAQSRRDWQGRETEGQITLSGSGDASLNWAAIDGGIVMRSSLSSPSRPTNRYLLLSHALQGVPIFMPI